MKIKSNIQNYCSTNLYGQFLLFPYLSTQVSKNNFTKIKFWDFNLSLHTHAFNGCVCGCAPNSKTKFANPPTPV